MREGRVLTWAILGAVVLVLYGVVAALQPIPEFRRVYAVYAVYDGIFVVLSIVWAALLDNFHPDRYDLMGTLVVPAGVLITVASQRP